jgi:CRP-like cAMP-binding protein
VDIARLAGGGSFGALALLDGKPRMTSIKTLSRCHLMTLSKTEYNKTLQTIEQKTRMVKVNFIKKIPLFSKLTNTQLTRFSFFLKPLKCTKDHYLYKEGETADMVFIIK